MLLSLCFLFLVFVKIESISRDPLSTDTSIHKIMNE